MDSDNSLNFKIKLVKINKIGPFLKFNIKGFFDYCCNYDVVLGLSNIRFYQLMNLCLKRRPFKLALWGIGVTGSYTKQFGSWSLATKLRVQITKYADGLIFYSDAPISMYKKAGFSSNRMYVAHNTVDNIVPFNKESNRDSILFVGTLYRAKGLELLLEQYLESYKQIGDSIHKLVIVGDGDILSELKEFTVNNGLTEYVQFVGAIYDSAQLKTYFDRACFSVSLTQAGLSVLTSMSFGVPFVTRKDAITGGEILNIRNGFNGCLLDNNQDLITLINRASVDPNYFYTMGVNAYKYYREQRNPEIMANAIIKCIKEI